MIGRVAYYTSLLRKRVRLTGTEGSNPSSSAITYKGFSMEDYIKSLRAEATELEEDTLVSMCKGVSNSKLAKRLREIADDLEKLIKG